MSKICLGILGPSEIAGRRFLPSLMRLPSIKFAGVATASTSEWSDNPLCDVSVLEREQEKAQKLNADFDGKRYDSYGAMLEDTSIDAVYIPLPPSLHFRWAKAALKSNKHVLLEKPFTTCAADSEVLLTLAANKGLVVHENFAFIYHEQIREIESLLARGLIGEPRHIRAAFGFPHRGREDFRYSKALGGGALLDCGGYPLKLANHLLGGHASITAASLSTTPKYDVDIFGSAMLQNEAGLAAQIAFGMDNAYKCELEIWGSTGCIFAPRVFTPTAQMSSRLVITGENETEIYVEPDDSFYKSILQFERCICENTAHLTHYETIRKQAELIDKVHALAQKATR